MDPLIRINEIAADIGAATTFEQYVTEWLALQALVKALTEVERNARKHILAAAFPSAGSPDFPEGTHHFKMNDGRKITYTHKISRKVDPALVPVVREEFAALNDRPTDLVFDDLLKMEYSVVISAFRKLEPGTPAAATVAKMITAKAAETPDLKVT